MFFFCFFCFFLSLKRFSKQTVTDESRIDHQGSTIYRFSIGIAMCACAGVTLLDGQCSPRCSMSHLREKSTQCRGI